MQKVRVIAPMGATLRGPLTVRLSKEQHAPRAHVLGKVRKDGVYDLDGDQALTFKSGEVLGVEKWEGRLNKALFELVEPVQSSNPAPADTQSGGGDTQPGGGDTQPGGGAA